MSNKTKDTLTPKQILFVHFYLIHRNATKAAKKAGYSARSAESTGCRILSIDKVKAEIDLRMGKKLKKLEIDADRVLLEMTRLALYDPADLYDNDGKLILVKDLPEDTRRAIRGWDVEQQESSHIDDKGNTYRVDRNTSIKPRMADKRPVLRDLGQHFDLFEPEDEDKKRPIHINVKIGGSNGKKQT